MVELLKLNNNMTLTEMLDITLANQLALLEEIKRLKIIISEYQIDVKD